MSEPKQPSEVVEVATQCADGEWIESSGRPVPYPLDQADAHCPCGGPHWIGKRTVTYGAWEPIALTPLASGPEEVR